MVLFLLALVIGLAPGASFAQNSSRPETVWLPLDDSIRACKESGKLLVVITSSGKQPASRFFASNFKRVVDEASSELDVMFSEMPAESFGESLQRMRVNDHPTVIIYQPTPKGTKLISSRSGFQSVGEAVVWLDAQGALRSKVAATGGKASRSTASSSRAPQQVARRDRSVRPAENTEPIAVPHDDSLERTGGDGAVASDQRPYPTEQGERRYPPPTPPKTAPPYIPPPQAPPVQMAPPPQQYYQPPVYTGQQATPLVVSPPSVPMVIQPQAPTVVVGPTPQPNIIFAAAPPSAPTISYAPMASAPAPAPAPAPTANAPQLFMASAPAPQPQPAYAPAPQPQPMAYAPAPQPQPMAYAPAPQPQPVAYAPAPQPMASAPQQGQIAQSPALLAAVLTNPSLVNRMLGALGEHLAQRRNPRIQMGQAPQMMQAPVAAAPAPAPMASAPMAYAPAGYGPQPGMMYMAVPNGPPPGYGYGPPPGYGYGPPPGNGYGPPQGGPDYGGGYPPQGPRQPYYPPQGPPPVAPTPQGEGSSWSGHFFGSGGQAAAPSSAAPEKKGWLHGMLSK
ncbi:hypothetical protein [Aquisphaera insulae]|uniref:hypothetical protein n=1 Tax=Aquisphaera insulae TaxID=2712864 RepID=UPI0013EB175C|nr:hypothetical protein [Aquisphaera insulae]